jgi:hypothetical protein
LRLALRLRRQLVAHARQIVAQVGAGEPGIVREDDEERAQREGRTERARAAPNQPGTRRNGASTKVFDAAFQMNSLWAVTSPLSTAVTRYESSNEGSPVPPMVMLAASSALK